MSNNFVKVIHCDRKGRIWVCTELGISRYRPATEDAGINIYDAHDGTFTPFHTPGTDLGTNIHSLHYDPATDEMWIGTFRNGLHRYHLSRGTMRSYLLTRGMPSDAIFDFACDAQGRLWIATTQGLRHYNPETDSFQKTSDELLNLERKEKKRSYRDTIWSKAWH